MEKGKVNGKVDWNKLVETAKAGNGKRTQSGLRQHIRETLAEVPKEVRSKLQGASIGVWCQVLRAVLKEKYPETHGKDRNLYNKVRVNLTSWSSEFEIDDNNNVKYLKWGG